MYYSFLSFIFEGEPRENDYQYLCQFKRESNNNWDFIAKVSYELEEFFNPFLYYTAPSETIQFLSFHYSKFIENNPGKGIDFLFWLEGKLSYIKRERVKNQDTQETIEVVTSVPDNRKKVIQDWIEEKRKGLKAGELQQPLKKIKWNGSPSVFGYLFLELVKKGFITPPPFNGEPNFTELSRLCFEYFDINTTPENLKKALNEKSNQLSDTKRAKFTIPEQPDLE